MTGFMHEKEFSRKTFVKGTGAVVAGLSAASALAGNAVAAPPTSAGYLPDATQLDSWLSFNTDGSVTLKMSQIETGNGITTGFLQLLGEDLQEAGRDPVAGFDLAHLERDRAVGVEREPRVQLRGVRKVPGRRRRRGDCVARERRSSRETGDDCAGALDERLARELLLMHEARHRLLPSLRHHSG